MGTAAVFLSCASEDADAAAAIAGALRAVGIEVWCDKSELRGSDAWDQQIRTQIRACRRFIPLISPRTDARDEGYFRREWKLAVDRMDARAGDKAFLVPVAIDGAANVTARVPPRFRELQWIELCGRPAQLPEERR